MSTVRLTLIGKPECHLCEEADAVVKRVIASVSGSGAGAAKEAQTQRHVEVELEELNILDDPSLAEKHAEFIPVLLVNGKRHSIWKVDEAKLTATIEKAARRRFFR